MRFLRNLALIALLGVPLAAAAQYGSVQYGAMPYGQPGQYAYTTRDVNMRAGPDPSYPLVARLPAGVNLAVGGCLQSYTWCDVYTNDVRGWVYASYLAYPYQSSEVPIYSFGPALGLPIISFSIGSYWDNYYRGRPFYSNRNYWYGRPYRAPPPRFHSDWRAPSPPPPHRPPGYRPPPGGGYQSGGDYHRPPRGSSADGYRPPHGNNDRPPPSSSRPPPQQRPDTRPDGTYRDTHPNRNNASGGEAGG
ncbi:MAG TPA: SH3 domain-containing protein [Casimicrobiaceae bacterium]|jgi:uncharacterized protein YraI|nr:SH3 domain-containing protein [Casimicrobiaceae bacterium]